MAAYLDDEAYGVAARDLAGMSHAELYARREKARGPGEQKRLAAYEHRAFAREFAEESPVKAAVSLPIAIPLYSAAKALGVDKVFGTDESKRTPASMEEMKQGFLGLGEGLRKRFTTKRK
jgi:hypothetical protein